MKFRTGLLLGIAIGYALSSRKLFERGEDEPIVRHPSDARGRGRRGDLGQRLAEQAGSWGLKAIHQARGAIRGRLEATDDPTWN